MKEMTKAQATRELHRRGIPVFAGAQPANDISWPLGPPTVETDGSISVPAMLKEPTRITAMVRDMSLEQFILDYLFTSGGGVTGGAVVYDQPSENDLYLTRDVQRVEPGSEFPIITSERGVPKVATVEKWGAKTFITWEARDRNDGSLFTDEMRKLTNTIIRKLNQRAIEEINAIFATYTSQTWGGNDWTSVTTLGSSPTAYSLQPVGDFVDIQEHNEGLELGITHDTLILNPQEKARLQLIYGPEWASVLQTYGYTRWFVSKQVTAGTMLSLAGGGVGEMRIEQPLMTETWADKDGRQQDWVQTSVRPLLFVKQPLNIVKVTGLAG